MYKDVREMAITHDDFFRLLPKALGRLDYQIDGMKVSNQREGKSMMITLSEESTRKIASLILPLTHVTLELKGYTELEQKAFLDRFYLAYQKGGG